MPTSVLIKVQDELLNFQETESSLMELSHRSKEFENVLNEAIQDLKKLLTIPPNYKILFMQGGATIQVVEEIKIEIKIKIIHSFLLSFTI